MIHGVIDVFIIGKVVLKCDQRQNKGGDIYDVIYKCTKKSI